MVILMQEKNIEFKETEEVKKNWTLKKIIKILLMVMLIIILIILYSRFIGTKGLVVKEYKITNNNFVNNFYGLKIVQISDIHYGDTTTKKDLDKIVNKINMLKPDVVIFTGDLYSKDLTDEEKDELMTSLKQISANMKKYAIIGNHDKEDWQNIIKAIDFTPLNNDIDLIYNNNNASILFAGLNTSQDIQEGINTINKLSSQYEDSENNSVIYKILLLHEPDKIEKFDYSKYNVILAGHSHNGQIKLPFIGAIYKPVGAKKYYDEYYNLGNTEMYISSGIGTTTFKLRLFNHPSINLYRLANK